jgi:hypothetical protein
MLWGMSASMKKGARRWRVEPELNANRLKILETDQIGVPDQSLDAGGL